tara:strand:+ start:1245 stop:2069 length:825 start_codon:yes stop_codon:yes gene_type:complete
MNRSYSKKIYNILNENKLRSLKILLEEEGEEKKSKSEDKADSIFGALDDESSDTKKDDDKNDKESDEAEDQETVEKDVSSEDVGQDTSDEFDKETVDQIATKFDKYTEFVNQNRKEPFQQVKDAMEKAFNDAAIVDVVSEAKKIKTSLVEFLNEDDKNINKLTKSMTNLDTAIKKSTETLDGIEKGIAVNMEVFVNSAMENLEHVDSLFSKADIVKNASLNVLASKCGSRAKENMEEFERLFSAKLQKEKGIDDESNFIPANKTYIAVGGRDKA